MSRGVDGDQRESGRALQDLRDVTDRSGHQLYFSLFPFCNKSFAWKREISDPHISGNAILFRSSQQLPRFRLGHFEDFLS